MAWDVVSKYKLDMSGKTDNVAALLALSVDMAQRRAVGLPLPQLDFSEGVLAFSKWPDLAFSRLHMVAHGQCVLKHIGAGDAVVFDGSLHPNACWDMQFDNFFVLPGPQTQNSLVLNEIHWSVFRKVGVQGAGPPTGAALYSGLVQHWCVSTRFDDFNCLVNDAAELSAQTFNCNGIWLDGPMPARAKVQAAGPTTMALFINTNISLVDNGIVLNNANNAMFINGAVQGTNKIGMLINKSGYSRVMNVDFESNKGLDIHTVAGQAHSNKIWRPGNISAWKLKLDGWNNTVVADVQDGMFGM